LVFNYDKGVFTGYLHCNNYESLLDSGEIEEIDEEKGLLAILISA